MLAHQLAEKEVYESKLQVALDQAQRASKAKSDFLARMTHEIRTPINAILGFNKMIEENPHNESNFQTWHRKIDVSGKHHKANWAGHQEFIARISNLFFLLIQLNLEVCIKLLS